ncbi:MAGUK p55 subfamily member 7 [Toxocara canis]|uniref:MAGUK p55 subfamily member 7 n=1 Tax=Toxocara canis TaxID=6265 RepID=A0A0B2USM1_TOXCA|nr:MAGUK p55 subfamily member 7 [Toxocara canis]
MSPDTTTTSLQSFAKAFEGILEGIALENGSRKKFIAEDQKAISAIHKLLSTHRSNVGCRSAGEPSVWELSECLLCEWEESAPPSVAVQQMVSLLSKPLIKNLLWTYDQVAERRFSPQLPDIPYEVDDEEGVAVKLVRLVKGNEPLGATIKCDAEGCVFVARIIAGGVAERSACIQVGDRVMEVNGVSVTGMKPADIVKLLSTDGGLVSFKLIPAGISSNVESDEPRYVKTLADYCGSRDTLHPCPEAALSFVRGEILQLVLTGDQHWWQARSLGFAPFANPADYCGSRDTLHPCPEAALSFVRGEILQLVLTGDQHWWQARSLGFAPFANPVDEPSDGKRRIGLIPSELLHVKRRSQRDCDVRKAGTRKTTKNAAEQCEYALYESVSLISPSASLIRPIVLLGASGVGRNELKRRLILSDCERYSTTVPHTSRPPRAHETEGVDYFFVKREQMEQWIRQARFLEYGEYKGNLYGTLADSVVNLIKKGRIPVLSPHPLALRLLRSSTFKPFVIFVQPPDFETFKETRTLQRAHSSQIGAPYSRGFTDAQIEQIISCSEQLFRLYAYCCDMVLVNGNIQLAFTQLCQAIAKLDKQPCWIPSAWIEQANNHV